MKMVPKLTPEGVVWEPAHDASQAANVEDTATAGVSSSQEDAEHTSASPSESEPSPTKTKVKKRRRPWVWVVLVLLVALAGWIVYQRLTISESPTPAPAPVSTATSTPGLTSAEKAAINYENAMLSANSMRGCGMEVNTDRCLRVVGSSLRPLKLSENPRILQTAHVSRPGSAGDRDQEATAILVQFTVADQPNAQREVVFVRSDDRIIGTVGVGRSDAGRTLQDLFNQMEP